MRNLHRHNAFTLVEILVAVALLVVIIAMAGTVFRVGIESQRMAQANAEIMQKFRSITDQLNADFRGLCKDGDIFVTWKTKNDGAHSDHGRHLGDDRIVFFTKGDFQSYKSYDGHVIRGNIARVSYMLGSKRDPQGQLRPAMGMSPSERVLQRTQHILTQDETLVPFAPLLDANETATDQAWYAWHNTQEYDVITLQQWSDMDDTIKSNVLSVSTRTIVQTTDLTDRDYWGSQYEESQPALHAHSLLSEGVGTFKIQGWFETLDPSLTGRRWVPDDDPNQDGNYSNSELLVAQDDSLGDDVEPLAGVLYSGGSPFAAVSLGGEFEGRSFNQQLTEERFNEIPGLGRALKFTFTLYDSKGLIPDGRTFTHIVKLD